MRAIEVIFGGIVTVAIIALLVRDGGAGANSILQGAGDFNQKTFGTLFQR